MGVHENAKYNCLWNRHKLVSIGFHVSTQSVEMAKSTGAVKQPVKLPGMESNCEFGVISSVIVVKQLVKTAWYILVEICTAVCGPNVNCLPQSWVDPCPPCHWEHGTAERNCFSVLQMVNG